MESRNIVDLPKDSLYDIFLHLDDKDLLNVCVTCKRLYRLASADRAWKPRVAIGSWTKDSYVRFCDTYLPTYPLKRFCIWTSSIPKTFSEIEKLKSSSKIDWYYANKLDNEKINPLAALYYFIFLTTDRLLWRKADKLYDYLDDTYKYEHSMVLPYVDRSRISEFLHKMKSKFLIEYIFIIIEYFHDIELANTLFKKLVLKDPLNFFHRHVYANFLWEYMDYRNFEELQTRLYEPGYTTARYHYLSTFDIKDPNADARIQESSVCPTNDYFECGLYDKVLESENIGDYHSEVLFHIKGDIKGALEKLSNPHSTLYPAIACYQGKNAILMDWVGDEYYMREPITYFYLLVLRFIHVNGDTIVDVENLKSIKYYLETLYTRTRQKILFRKNLTWCKYRAPGKYPLARKIVQVFHGKYSPKILSTFILYNSIQVPPREPKPVPNIENIQKLFDP